MKKGTDMVDVTVEKDLDALTLTVVATFNHPVEKVWDLYADPRKLERWWGPPGYPATVTEHELSPGGMVRYFMTSPEGEKYYGLWNVKSVDAGKSFVAEDLFADDNGEANTELPSTMMTFDFTATETGSKMTSVSTYANLESLEQILAMGVVEGLKGAMSQMEAILAE